MGTEKTKWTNVNEDLRKVVISELERLVRKCEKAGDSKMERAFTSAIGRLTLPERAKVKRPVDSYQETDLRKRLELDESRAKTIAHIVKVVKSAENLSEAAEELGISRRTLTRTFKDFPMVREAVEKARAA